MTEICSIIHKCTIYGEKITWICISVLHCINSVPVAWRTINFWAACVTLCTLRRQSLCFILNVDWPLIWAHFNLPLVALTLALISTNKLSRNVTFWLSLSVGRTKQFTALNCTTISWVDLLLYYVSIFSTEAPSTTRLTFIVNPRPFRLLTGLRCWLMSSTGSLTTIPA